MNNSIEYSKNKFKEFMSIRYAKYLLVAASGNSLSYKMDQPAQAANGNTACCLFLLGIFPGVIYYFANKKDAKIYVLQVIISESGGITLSGDDSAQISAVYSNYLLPKEQQTTNTSVVRRNPTSTGDVFSWVFGVLFIMAFLGVLVVKPVSAIFYLLSGLLLLPPIAKSLENKFKITIPAWVRVLIVIVLFMTGATLAGSESVSLAPNNVPSNSVNTLPKKISYELLKSWTIPNGGYGQLILISKSNVNLEDMTLLGNQLKDEHKSERNSFIDVYTDRKAAELRDNMPNYGEENDQQTKFYDDNYVGSYAKNINTGFHQFDIFLNGVSGEPTVVKY